MFIKTKLTASIAMVVAVLMSTTTAQAQTKVTADQWSGADTLTANLQKRYPATPFKNIKETPIKGIYEVTMGKNIGYVEASGRYFMFGHLFDMQTQADLTVVPKEAANKVNFKDLPLQNAIKIKKGNGKRVFAVFSDPECPFCKQLENTLSRVDDYTMYVFLMPLDAIHPKARAEAVNIWCANKPVEAWHNLMLDAAEPSKSTCASSPLDANIKLGESLGATGTPTLIREDGTVAQGALPKAELENWLSGVTK